MKGRLKEYDYGLIYQCDLRKCQLSEEHHNNDCYRRGIPVSMSMVRIYKKFW